MGGNRALPDSGAPFSQARMVASMNLGLSDWNWVELMLHGAMVGSVSPNFRMVELAFEEMKWVVRVTLREENDDDREEIGEICDSFSVGLVDVRECITEVAYAEIVSDVIVSEAPIYFTPRAEPRVVFRMRERQP